jgi:hypothetical protein
MHAWVYVCMYVCIYIKQLIYFVFQRVKCGQWQLYWEHNRGCW